MESAVPIKGEQFPQKAERCCQDYTNTLISLGTMHTMYNASFGRKNNNSGAACGDLFTQIIMWRASSYLSVTWYVRLQAKNSFKKIFLPEVLTKRDSKQDQRDSSSLTMTFFSLSRKIGSVDQTVQTDTVQDSGKQ